LQLERRSTGWSAAGALTDLLLLDWKYGWSEPFAFDKYNYHKTIKLTEGSNLAVALWQLFFRN